MTTTSTPSTCPVHPVILEILLRSKDHVFTLLNASLSFFTNLHKVVSSGSMSSTSPRSIRAQIDGRSNYETGDELLNAYIARLQGEWNVKSAVEIAWDAAYIDFLRSSDLSDDCSDAKTKGNFFAWIAMLRVILPKEIYPEVLHRHNLTLPVWIELQKMSSDDINDFVFASSEIVRGWIQATPAPSVVPSPLEDPVAADTKVAIDEMDGYHDALSKTISSFREKSRHRDALLSMVEALRLVLESKFDNVVTTVNRKNNPMKVSITIGDERFMELSFAVSTEEAFVWFFDSHDNSLQLTEDVTYLQKEFTSLALQALRAPGIAIFIAKSMK